MCFPLFSFPACKKKPCISQDLLTWTFSTQVLKVKSYELLQEEWDGDVFNFCSPRSRFTAGHTTTAPSCLSVSFTCSSCWKWESLGQGLSLLCWVCLSPDIWWGFRGISGCCPPAIGSSRAGMEFAEFIPCANEHTQVRLGRELSCEETNLSGLGRLLFVSAHPLPPENFP